MSPLNYLYAYAQHHSKSAHLLLGEHEIKTHSLTAERQQNVEKIENNKNYQR